VKNAGSKRIAERYVKALFDVAKGANALADVEKDLGELASLLVQSKELKAFIANPLIGRAQQAAAMTALLTKAKAHKLTVDFVAALARAKRLDVLAVIVAQFIERAATARGEIGAVVTTPAKLGDKDAGVLAEKLTKAYGKKVNLQLEEDASLLGGMIVKIGSIQLDSSLAGKLDRLRLSLKAA